MVCTLSKQGYSAATVCELLEISRSTFYYKTVQSDESVTCLENCDQVK